MEINFGTGFCLDPACRYVATNYHVISKAAFATATFADGNDATFAYATTGSSGVPAANQSKAITRFLFAAPAGTTCQ